jgi:hypothetical protein
MTTSSWSAAGYLKQARGPFADLFRWLAGQPNLLANADLITRLASLGGIGSEMEPGVFRPRVLCGQIGAAAATHSLRLRRCSRLAVDHLCAAGPTVLPESGSSGCRVW